MSKTKIETKLKNLEGMKGAIEAIVAQAWERGYKYGLHEAEQKLNNEPKKGKWIGTDNEGFGRLFACNCCRSKSVWISNFCPNCGADMREADNDKID